MNLKLQSKSSTGSGKMDLWIKNLLDMKPGEDEPSISVKIRGQ